MKDGQWATLGRHLADALMKWAHERGDAEKKHVAALQTELCQERRSELDEPPPEPEPQPLTPPPPAPSSPPTSLATEAIQ